MGCLKLDNEIVQFLSKNTKNSNDSDNSEDGQNILARTNLDNVLEFKSSTSKKACKNKNQATSYDANSGRFMSKDPKGVSSGDLNLYRYVGNRPMSAVDPSGNSTVSTATGAVLDSTTNIGPIETVGAVVAGALATPYGITASFVAGMVGGAVGSLFDSDTLSTSQELPGPASIYPFSTDQQKLINEFQNTSPLFIPKLETNTSGPQIKQCY